MNSQKILYGAGLVCLATILPVSFPAQAEKLSQNSIEINRQQSSQDSQRKESKNTSRRDRQSDQNYNEKSREYHNRDRHHDGESEYRDSDRNHNGERSEKEHR
jgi:hypothetical protein